MMERYCKCKAFILSPFEECTTKLIDKCNYCMIWYHLYNLYNMKNTYGGVLLFKKLQTLALKLLHGCFSRCLNCTNGTKSRKASQT